MSDLTIYQVKNLAKELLNRGANPNLVDIRQETPLHIAVKVNYKKMFRKTREILQDTILKY